MDSEQVKAELIERYMITGKIGFIKPKNMNEALEVAETISSIYENDEEKTYSLSELAYMMKSILD